MTSLSRLALVAAALFASSSTVMAQVRNDRVDQAYARAWNENGDREVVRRSPSLNPAYDVYDGQRYVGSDPSVRIRSEIIRDREARE
jgi:hypothetical protein